MKLLKFALFASWVTLTLILFINWLLWERAANNLINMSIQQAQNIQRR